MKWYHGSLWTVFKLGSSKGETLQRMLVSNPNNPGLKPQSGQLTLFLLLVSVERCKRESVCIYSTHRGVSVRIICLRASRVQISPSPRLFVSFFFLLFLFLMLVLLRSTHGSTLSLFFFKKRVGGEKTNTNKHNIIIHGIRWARRRSDEIRITTTTRC